MSSIIKKELLGNKIKTETVNTLLSTIFGGVVRGP